MKRLALNFVLGAAMAAALLWFVQAQLLTEVATDGRSGWAALWDAVAALPVWAVPAYALVFLTVHLLRTFRWVLQVEPLGETDLRKVFRVCAVGYAAIVLFPFRLGELVRPYLLAHQSARVGFSEAMGTAVVERIFDGLFITGLLFVAVATAPLEGSATVRNAGWVCAGVFCSAAFGLTLFVLARPLAERLIRWTFGLADAAVERVLGRQLGLVDKLTAMLQGFVDGLVSLRSSGGLIRFLVLTVAYWAVNAFGIWLLAAAFGIHFPLFGAFGVLAVLVVGIMVPSAPGFLGTFQLFLTEGLKLYVAIDHGALGAAALAFALVMNVIQLIIQVGFAIPFLGKLDLRLADLFAVQQAAAREANESHPG